VLGCDQGPWDHVVIEEHSILIGGWKRLKMCKLRGGKNKQPVFAKANECEIVIEMRS